MLADLRFALRAALKRPAATLAVVAILGSAIAVATVMGAFFAALVDHLPAVDAPESLVRVWRLDEGRPAGHREPTVADFQQWRASARTLDALTASQTRRVVVGGADGRVAGALMVTVDYFRLAHRQPRLGRAFDAAPGADEAIVSDRLWRERFDGDPRVVGRTVMVDARPREIVGVMPPGFWMPSPGVDVWLPLDATATAGIVDIVGRLPPGITIEQAQAEFDLLARRAAPPGADSREHRTLLRTFRGEAIATIGPRVSGLVAPSLALLLIACANVGNLLVIRMMSRARERAIRVALGATPLRLARASLAESALVATGGGVAGLLLATWGLRLLRLGLAGAMPALADTLPIGRFLPATAAVATILTVGGTSLLPALSAMRRDIAASIAGRRSYSIGDVLVVVQVALSVVLVLTSAMLIRVFGEIDRALRPAVDPSLYAARIVLPPGLDAGARTARLRGVLDEVAQVDPVASVALSSQMPAPAGPTTRIVAAAGRGSRDCVLSVVYVSDRYFDTLGLRTERGSIPASGGPAVIVSATAARTCWSEDASGDWRVRLTGAQDVWLPVVAVAPDLGVPAPAFVREFMGERGVAWVLGDDWPASAYLLVRPRTTHAELAEPVAKAVARASATVAMEPLVRVADVAASQLAGGQLVIGLLAVVAVVALILAFTGVYAALSQSCAQRIVELGIRLALGADARRLIATAVAHDAPLVVAGIVAGLTGTLCVTRVVWRDMLSTSGADPRVWVAVCVLLAAAGALASIGPVLRAVRVDPLAVLRAE